MSDNQEQSIKEFVRELQTMTESRPPISKAKMMSITKSALKSIKYYKHIVMNVEKFISKCKPEYKIPGLYVIDSIVRQSRHQHGIEKDVYGSRFAKNILNTLHHVEKCPSDDKNKISRVLNLWEKNAIFPPNLIKELFQAHQSMIKTDEFLEKLVPTEKLNNEKALGGTDYNRFRELQETLLRASGNDDPETTSILTEIQQITNQLLESQKKTNTTNSIIDEPSSTTTSFINTSETMNSNVANVLDDFDYGSDNDDDEPREKTTTIAKLPPPTQQQQQQQPTMQPINLPPTNIPQPVQFFQTPPTMLINPTHPNTVSFPMTDANNMSIPMSFDPTHPPPIFFQQPLPSSLSMQQINYNHHSQMMTHQMQPNDVDCRPEDMDADSLDDHRPHHHHQYNRRRSRSPSPSSHHSKRTRSSSNSMNRRDSATSRLKETEKRERHRKGLPPLKEDHLVVSSRTIWLGHLPKMIAEVDLREHLEPYGEINDINHIPPRGCAFICFKERSDAARCLEKMKDFRLHGNSIKIGWATNKGVKDRFKEYWDGDHGCTYIPYSDIKNMPNLSTLAEGGVIDDESLPPFLKTNTPSVQTEVPQLIQQQQQQPTQPFIPPQAQFIRPEFQSAGNAAPNRLPQAPTILMAPPSHESPLRLGGVPVQMMPPGAQIIQVQQHPHGQPVQVIQRIGDIGRVFPNSQIVHQMPYGHVVTAAGQQPPTIQLQHQDLNGQTLVQGPALFQLHDDGRRQISPSNTSKHFDETQRHHISSTDEQLLRLSTSSASHFPPPLLTGPMSSSPSRIHQPHLLSHQQQQQQQQAVHPFINNVLPGQTSSALLPIPTNNDEHKKQPTFPRRQSRFEDRDDNVQTQDNNNVNYSGYRGGRNSFNDRGNPNMGSRNPNRGRGAGIPISRSHYNNTNTNDRSDNNDNNGGGYRNRNNFNRGGRGGNPSNNITINHSNNGGSSRYYPRGGGGGHRGGSSHEHSSSRRSSRSPDHSFSYRSLPTEALRKIDHSNLDIPTMPDETNSNRNEHPIN